MTQRTKMETEAESGDPDKPSLGCTVRFRSLVESQDPDDNGWREHVEIHVPESLEDLVAYLKGVRNRHVTEMADRRAESSDPGPIDPSEALGGFGVEVTNRWGSVVEVAAGKDAWFLFRHLPAPSRSFSDVPSIEGTRVFYLDGGHHTELTGSELASPEGCLRVLRHWLETNEFPERRNPHS